MLPSQFLNVVLEEVEGDFDSKTELFSQHGVTANYGLNDEPVLKPKKGNNNHLLIGWDYPKRLPEAFLSECTVELLKGPVVKKPLPPPRFDVNVVPIYGKTKGFINGSFSSKEGDTLSDEEEEEDEVEDEEILGFAALTEVEAVYSDGSGDSDSDTSNLPEPPTQALPFPQANLSVDQRSPVSEPGSIDNVCRTCSRVFPSQSLLWQHILSHHTDVKTCECPICGRQFYRNCSLALHIKSHAGDPPPAGDGSRSVTLSCDVCGAIQATPAALSRHMSAFHDEAPEEPPPADRPFKCPFCVKSYSQKSVLKKHLVIHTGERLQCTLCGIDFTQKSSLLRHIKRMHAAGAMGGSGRGRRGPRPTPPVHLPEHTAEFIQSLKIPQGISISMIDDYGA